MIYRSGVLSKQGVAEARGQGRGGSKVRGVGCGVWGDLQIRGTLHAGCGQGQARWRESGPKSRFNPAGCVVDAPPLQYVHTPPHLPSHSYRWDAGNVREVLEKKRAAGRMPVNIAEEKVSV